jgi:hypothetical protein
VEDKVVALNPGVVWTRIAVGLLALPLALAACSGGEKTDAAPAAGASDAAAATTTEAAETSPSAKAKAPEATKAPAKKKVLANVTAGGRGKQQVVTDASGKTTITAHDAEFRLPSGNISCVLSAASVRCDIRKASFKPPAKPKNCVGDYGKSIVLNAAAAAAKFTCVSDAVPRGALLNYGDTVRVASLSCLAETFGVTCITKKSSALFSLSRASFTFATAG